MRKSIFIDDNSVATTLIRMIMIYGYMEFGSLTDGFIKIQLNTTKASVAIHTKLLISVGRIRPLPLIKSHKLWICWFSSLWFGIVPKSFGKTRVLWARVTVTKTLDLYLSLNNKAKSPSTLIPVNVQSVMSAIQKRRRWLHLQWIVQELNFFITDWNDINLQQWKDSHKIDKKEYFGPIWFSFAIFIQGLTWEFGKRFERFEIWRKFHNFNSTKKVTTIDRRHYFCHRIDARWKKKVNWEIYLYSETKFSELNL